MSEVRVNKYYQNFTLTPVILTVLLKYKFQDFSIIVFSNKKRKKHEDIYKLVRSC